MMGDQVEGFVEGLIEKTREGKLDWKPFSSFKGSVFQNCFSRIFQLFPDIFIPVNMVNALSFQLLLQGLPVIIRFDCYFRTIVITGTISWLVA